MDNNLLLEMKQIDKRFTGVHALDHVDFSVKKGEIHALMGENGAGKSTLIKVLTGLYGKDSGQIIFDGEERNFHDPQDSQRAGISTIYQEINLIPPFCSGKHLHRKRTSEPVRYRLEGSQSSGQAAAAGQRY